MSREQPRSTEQLRSWEHDHTFGQDIVRPGERRTVVVVVITAMMMVVEIATGIIYGSMALLADGLHMASHAVALGIAVFAYVYARRHARDRRFSFGTGKVNSLAGFAGAILLAVFALIMSWESAARLVHPVAVEFDQALLVAVIGLVVNGLCVLILGHDDDAHGHSHAQAGAHHPVDHDQHHHDHHHGEQGHADHNLKSAYLHVLADALTSILAIAALLAGKYFGTIWMDPAMGFVGAFLVARWSWGLLRETARVLLDFQAPASLREAIVETLEDGAGTRVVDLHARSIAPRGHAVEVAVVAAEKQEPGYYRARLRVFPTLLHVTVEVNGPDRPASEKAAARRSEN